MKRSMRIMTSKEKRDFILLPIVMALMCIVLGGVMTLAAVKDGKPNLVYLMWVIAGLFFAYGATLWWESLKAWRNGESCRRGLKEENNPTKED